MIKLTMSNTVLSKLLYSEVFVVVSLSLSVEESTILLFQNYTTIFLYLREQIATASHNSNVKD